MKLSSLNQCFTTSHTDCLGCSTNNNNDMPMRCPVDGKCYKATSLEEFCVSCKDPVICK